MIVGRHPTGPGYRWRRGQPPFVPPAWVTAEKIIQAFLAIATPKPRNTAAIARPLPVTRLAAGAAYYVQAALRDAIQIVGNTPPGDRNNTLFRQTASLAELVNGRSLDRCDVEQGMLAAAMAAGLSETEAEATITSAFKAAGDTARTAPDNGPKYQIGDVVTAVIDGRVKAIGRVTGIKWLPPEGGEWRPYYEIGAIE